MVDLSQDQGVAVLDVEDGVLRINGLHPFIAAHREEFEGGRDTLVLVAMAEVLTEAHLVSLGVEPSIVRDAMNIRDELLRHFARSSARRNASTVAQALIDAAIDQDKLEDELVVAFQSMGFDAVRIGGSGKPDGKADAPLGAAGGKERRYSVSLEAKSKEKAGGTVAAKTVGVSTVALHRDEYKCHHAIVVAPEFPTSDGDKSSLLKQAAADRERSKKTITFVRVVDLAKLVRIVPLKGIGLDRIRDLFETCVSPESSEDWIDKLSSEVPKKPPFKEVLETIWELQQNRPFEPVEFSAVTTALQMGKKLVMKKEELVELCKTMAMMTTRVVVRETTVELTTRPDLILESFQAALQQFPPDERKVSVFGL
jgi:hypothetical protein